MLSSQGNSFSLLLVRFIIGIILIFLGYQLVAWNEDKAILADKTAARPEYQIVNIDASQVNPLYDDKLIYLSGAISSNESLKEPVFGMQIPALVLKRSVEMFQWSEVMKKNEGSSWFGSNKSYEQVDYEQVWSDKLINSTEFQFAAGSTYDNPKAFPVPPLVLTVSDAKLGEYIIEKAVLSEISSLDIVDLTSINLTQIERQFSIPSQFHHWEQGIFVGANVDSPTIGNLRIKLYSAKPQNYSIVAMQKGNHIVPYTDKLGRKIVAIQAGKVSAADLLSRASLRSPVVTWVFRILIFLLWIAGIVLVFQLLTAYSDRFPILAILHTNKMMFVALGLAAWIYLFLIAFHWFAYRPMFAVVSFVILSAIGYGAFRYLKR